MFFATSGSLALLDSTLRKSARDDIFLFMSLRGKRSFPWQSSNNYNFLIFKFLRIFQIPAFICKNTGSPRRFTPRDDDFFPMSLRENQQLYVILNCGFCVHYKHTSLREALPRGNPEKILFNEKNRAY